MTAAATPLIEITGVTKHHDAGPPLRVRTLRVAEGDRLSLVGFARTAAEMTVLLITGAALPEDGIVRIDGQDTRAIATDTQWLTTLDRFGIVTHRAVLLDSLSVAANLALPITLAIDPMSTETRARVDVLADDVGLSRAGLDAPVSALSAEERVRVHLARALALQPKVLLLEQPTAGIESGPARARLGAALQTAANRHRLGWLSFDDDGDFVRASGGRELRLNPETGDLVGGGFWRRLWPRQH